jgi:metalloendopeptidase OMA1, mitochondrial
MGGKVLTVSLLESADHVGLKITARACYDPHEASQMWRRMSMVEQRSGRDLLSKYDFLSTHPANEKRIAKINEWLPEVTREFA